LKLLGKAQLLAGLQSRVFHPDVIDYTFSRFEKQLRRRMNRGSGEASAMRRRGHAIAGQIHHCTEAMAKMGLSNALRSRLTDLKAEHRELSEKLASFEPRAIKLGLRDSRRFVETRLRNLHAMLTGEARLVRAEIAKHVQKITLTPDGRTYTASGRWDLLG
jgi:hypothetical protein